MTIDQHIEMFVKRYIFGIRPQPRSIKTGQYMCKTGKIRAYPVYCNSNIKPKEIKYIGWQLKEVK